MNKHEVVKRKEKEIVRYVKGGFYQTAAACLEDLIKYRDGAN